MVPPSHPSSSHCLLSLCQHSFCEVERVGNFNLFSDTSAMVYRGRAISLNMAARRCRGENDESLGIDHAADPYERPAEESF
jgi:hypothetical protein